VLNVCFFLVEMYLEVSVDSVDSLMQLGPFPSHQHSSQSNENSFIQIEKVKIALNVGLSHREVRISSDLCQVSVSLLEEGSCLQITKIAASLAVSANQSRLVCLSDIIVGLSGSRYLHATTCRVFLESRTVNDILQIVEDLSNEVSRHSTVSSDIQERVVRECGSEARSDSIPDYCTGDFEFSTFSLEQLIIDDYVKNCDVSIGTDLALFDVRLDKLALEMYMEISTENEERSDSHGKADGHVKGHLELIVKNFQIDLYNAPDSFCSIVSIASAAAFFSSSSPNQWLRRVKILDASKSRGHAFYIKLESSCSDTGMFGQLWTFVICLKRFIGRILALSRIK
jgi:hypothetical protein